MSNYNSGRPRQIAARYVNEDATIPPSGTPGGGSVTTVNTGTGLTGGPITGSGTISLAPNAVEVVEWAHQGLTSALNGLSIDTTPNPGFAGVVTWNLHFTAIKQAGSTQQLVIVSGELICPLGAGAPGQTLTWGIDFNQFFFVGVGDGQGIYPPFTPRSGNVNTPWVALAGSGVQALDRFPITSGSPGNFTTISCTGFAPPLGIPYKFYFTASYRADVPP